MGISSVFPADSQHPSFSYCSVEIAVQTLEAARDFQQIMGKHIGGEYSPHAGNLIVGGKIKNTRTPVAAAVKRLEWRSGATHKQVTERVPEVLNVGAPSACHVYSEQSRCFLALQIISALLIEVVISNSGSESPAELAIGTNTARLWANVLGAHRERHRRRNQVLAHHPRKARAH
jgi:hypothetical protein